MKNKKTYKVTAKQENSKMCFVCGLTNNLGLKASFYETDKQELIAVFTPGQAHQGYPGRLHGGIAAAILDEAIGRNINMNRDDQLWGVTVDFNIRFKKPIPLDKPLKTVTRLTKENRRFFEGSGEIVLDDGTIAATARGKYYKMPIKDIASDFTMDSDDWKVVKTGQDPARIDVP
ncbi:MAG: PaaI family thioesterase [Actinomycetia bacterium]|nr:PaaI family thioesterase [Actinomycetes bacterium]